MTAVAMNLCRVANWYDLMRGTDYGYDALQRNAVTNILYVPVYSLRAISTADLYKLSVCMLKDDQVMHAEARNYMTFSEPLSRPANYFQMCDDVRTSR